MCLLTCRWYMWVTYKEKKSVKQTVLKPQKVRYSYDNDKGNGKGIDNGNGIDSDNGNDNGDGNDNASGNDNSNGNDNGIDNGNDSKKCKSLMTIPQGAFQCHFTIKYRVSILRVLDSPQKAARIYIWNAKKCTWWIRQNTTSGVTIAWVLLSTSPQTGGRETGKGEMVTQRIKPEPSSSMVDYHLFNLVY